MSILRFPSWLVRDNSTTAAPPMSFRPSTSVIRGYCDDIDKYGHPMDSGLSSYFRKVATYYESKEKDSGHD